jgi:hypothetical protein
LYANGGKLLGGNSGFAHTGTYQDRDGEIVAEIITERHNFDPNYKPLLGKDIATLHAVGRESDGVIRFKGSTEAMPGARFWSVMTPIDDRIVPAPVARRDGDVVNGLYSISLRTLDDIGGGLSGIMLLHDGRILGGDAFFYYLGSYTCGGGRWRGEIVNQEHTPARGQVPVFGGHEVGIGFSGRYDVKGADLEATALAGKRSLQLSAVLRLIEPA